MQVGLQGFDSNEAAPVDQLNEHFASHHWLRLPKLIAPDLEARLRTELGEANFGTRVHKGVGLEDCLSNGKLTDMLAFLFNDPRLFEIVERLTGCDSIGNFDGRVYKAAHGKGHVDGWHKDVDGNRMVAMSITLTDEPFIGGALNIREAESETLIAELPNPGFGNALLFHLAPELQHRITDTLEGPDKIAYAGWFRREPRLQDLTKLAP
ncbi:2OG-Fe(II) oxygenase [Endomicrobium sp. AH-315-J14]|nr:2OG-Fe(II) oxygenase [Endomicrobium sp. AH-315-J14]